MRVRSWILNFYTDGHGIPGVFVQGQTRNAGFNHEFIPKHVGMWLLANAHLGTRILAYLDVQSLLYQ